MKLITSRSMRIALTAAIGLVCIPILSAQHGNNLIANGGFEQGTDNWRWEQWKGMPEPGYLNTDTPYKGRASYCMSLAGVEGSRTLSYSAVDIDSTKDYELSVALHGKELLANSVYFTVWQQGAPTSTKEKKSLGLINTPDPNSTTRLITAGGDFDWRELRVHIYRKTLHPDAKRLTIFIHNTSIGQGELHIDELSLIPLASTTEKRPTTASVEGKPPIPTVDGLTLQRHTEKETPKDPVSNTKVEEVLLDRGDSTEAWEENLGLESPGAKGDLSTVSEGDREVVKVAFDLSEGGVYVGAHYRDKIKESEAIVFEVQPLTNIRFRARIRDSTGQTHVTRFKASVKEWTTVALPLNKATFTKHWKGAKDGKIHFPLRDIIITGKPVKKKKGEFLLRNLSIRTRSPEYTWPVRITTNQPGHIHFADEAQIDLSAQIINALRRKRIATATVSIKDLDNRVITTKTKVLHFAPWYMEIINLSLPTPTPGYYRVEVSVAQDGNQETTRGAFGVAPRPLRYGKRDVDSFFGAHVNEPAIAARLGVHWHRHYHKWRWIERRRGVYSQNPNQLQRFLDAGIDVMMCLNYQEPLWIKKKVGPDRLPTPATIKRFAKFVRSSVRAHPFVSVFEIQNEPDLMLQADRNLTLEQGVDFYTRIFKAVAPIIREEAPFTPIAGANVSGQDQKAGFPMSRRVFKEVGGLFDIWAPHPYASPRKFGPGLSPLSPEDNRERAKHLETLAVIRELGRNHRYWVGEKGWSIKDETPLSGKIASSFADYTARSLIIAKSIPGVEKYFWFRISQDTKEGDDRYALFRGNPLQPMPGALAYANVAYRLDHSQPMASFKRASGTIHVNMFQRPMTNSVIATLWSVKTPYLLKANLPANVEAFDLYGRRIRLESETLALSETPLFIQTTMQSGKALMSALQNASYKPAEPFKVVAANLHDVRTLRISLHNNTSKVVHLATEVNGQTTRLVLLPNIEEPTHFDITLPQAVTNIKAISLPIKLVPHEGEPVTAPISMDLSPVVYRSGITVDANTNDWAGTPVIALKTRENILPPDKAGWQGPKDLSMRLSLAWDETALYMLVRVADDVHYTSKRDQFWEKDSLLIALDVMNNAGDAASFDTDDREYGMLLNRNGIEGFQFYPQESHLSDKFQAAGIQEGQEAVYEIAFPWSQLGREPTLGAVFSLNVTANDNDGSGRNYWMGLTAGSIEGKRPKLYKNFYLTK